jgi:hypothetical protein
VFGHLPLEAGGALGAQRRDQTGFGFSGFGESRENNQPLRHYCGHLVSPA